MRFKFRMEMPDGDVLERLDLNGMLEAVHDLRRNSPKHRDTVVVVRIYDRDRDRLMADAAVVPESWGPVL